MCTVMQDELQPAAGEMSFGQTFIALLFRPLRSDKSDYFSTKVCALGLKSGGKLVH